MASLALSARRRHRPLSHRQPVAFRAPAGRAKSYGGASVVGGGLQSAHLICSAICAQAGGLSAIAMSPVFGRTLETSAAHSCIWQRTRRCQSCRGSQRGLIGAADTPGSRRRGSRLFRYRPGTHSRRNGERPVRLLVPVGAGSALYAVAQFVEQLRNSPTGSR